MMLRMVVQDGWRWETFFLLLLRDGMLNDLGIAFDEGIAAGADAAAAGSASS